MEKYCKKNQIIYSRRQIFFLKLNYSCISPECFFVSPMLLHTGEKLMKFNFTKFFASTIFSDFSSLFGGAAAAVDDVGNGYYGHCWLDSFSIQHFPLNPLALGHDWSLTLPQKYWLQQLELSVLQTSCLLLLEFHRLQFGHYLDSILT